MQAICHLNSTIESWISTCASVYTALKSPKPAITDVLPTEIMQRIMKEVHAITTSKDLRCFAQIRRVSKSFNALVEPIVFRHVRIDPILYFALVEKPWESNYVKKIESLASLGHTSALPSLGGSAGSQEGSELESVWRGVKCLSIEHNHLVRGDYRVTEERLETLSRAIRGLKFVEHAKLELRNQYKPFLSIASRLIGLPLIELAFDIYNDCLEGHESGTHPVYSSFPSLRTLRLHFHGLTADTKSKAAQALHTFLKSCPELHNLFLYTDDKDSRSGPATPDAQNLLEMALTGANKLDSGAPALRTLSLTAQPYNIRCQLAFALDTRNLTKLILSTDTHKFVTTTNEQFWLALTKRGPNAIKLTELCCPCLTPALVGFLCGFSGLEKLEFYPRFYPEMPLNTRPDGSLAARDKDAELKLVDLFFNVALHAHKASLTHLALWEDSGWKDFPSMAPYLERVFQCTSLRVLHIPIRYPGEDLAWNIANLLPMQSLRHIGLSLPGAGSANRQIEEANAIIGNMRFTPISVPQFTIYTGRRDKATTFQWEFEGEGREVGRFRQLREVPLDWFPKPVEKPPRYTRPEGRWD